jgi:hypothetical protein
MVDGHNREILARDSTLPHGSGRCRRRCLIVEERQ